MSAQPAFSDWLNRGQKQAKPAYRIARRTKKRASQERKYNARVKVWLELPQNKWCTVFLARRGLTWHAVDETGMVGWEEVLFRGRKTARVPRATQCHHRAGRIGLKLLDERDWIPVSHDGHLWIHAHLNQARALGVMR